MAINYESQREPYDDSNGGVIYKIGRGAKWVVPLTAISAAAVSIARLSILRLFAMFKYAVADREERNRIERRARARGRDEGLSEGRMEGHDEAQAQIQAWWQQATNGGTQPPSLDNPPPLIDTDDSDADGSAA